MRLYSKISSELLLKNTGVTYKLKQANKSGFRTFLVFQKIKTPRQLIEQIETARPLKFDTRLARLMVYVGPFAAPIVDE